MVREVEHLLASEVSRRTNQSIDLFEHSPCKQLNSGVSGGVEPVVARAERVGGRRLICMNVGPLGSEVTE